MLSWMSREPRKQILRQGFLGKRFVKEGLQEASKGIAAAGWGRGRSQAKMRFQAVPERVV